MFDFQSFLSDLVYILPAVLISLTVHECAHAVASYKMGDLSQRTAGRMTLNPLKHLDPVGTLCLIFFGFGWAKPVMVDPYYYRNKKEGMMWTSLAGPLSNFVLAFLSLIGYGLIVKFAYGWSLTSGVGFYITTLLIVLAQINIGLGIFNLIPIPPLDGSKILMGILNEETYFKIMKYENYFMLAILLLLGSGMLNTPLVQARTTVMNAFINIIFKVLGMA